jgi:hypothetical protein
MSDTHLGYEAYPALSASGNNQRGEDMVRAFVNIARDAIEWDPALVIHAGDVTERPRVGVNYMLQIQQLLTKMASIRPDGTRRQVLVVAGNHELPRSRKESCWLELLSPIPGVRVVSAGQEVVRYTAGGDMPAELNGVAIHCLPHDALKGLDFATVVPDPDATANILVAHGVAMGSELFLRSLGREFPIEGDAMMRDWDYVALGHFHKRGPVGGLRRDGVDRVWYSGSPENVSFRDVRDNAGGKGYLRVEIDGPNLIVTPRDLPTRPMFRLPIIDTKDMAAGEITAALITNIESTDVSGAIVGQLLDNMNRDMWNLLDLASVRRRAGSALHYSITPSFARLEQAVGRGDGLGNLGAVLEEQIATTVNAALAGDVRKLATTLLGNALSGPIDPEHEVGEEVAGEVNA